MIVVIVRNTQVFRRLKPQRPWSAALRAWRKGGGARLPGQRHDLFPGRARRRGVWRDGCGNGCAPTGQQDCPSILRDNGGGTPSEGGLAITHNREQSGDSRFWASR